MYRFFLLFPCPQTGFSRVATQANHIADVQRGLAVNKNPLTRTQSASASVVMNSESSKEKAEEVARKVVWNFRKGLGQFNSAKLMGSLIPRLS